jgi:ribonuclease BN (tRNA processing enzyme)
MFVLESLRAKHGDALLLHYGTEEKPRLAVIDGGPPGVYNDALKPRLLEIRKERGLKETEPLNIDLMMVSHIDQDHIAGILELVRKMKDLRESKKPVPWKIGSFWHNAFDDILGNDDVTAASPASVMTPASLGDAGLKHEGSLILASVGEGRELRKLLDALNLAGNPPFKGLVRGGGKKVSFGNLKLTVVAPGEAEIQALQEEWDKKVKDLLKKEKDKESRAKIAAYVDESVFNLSSIVVLAEADGKRMLLTGDGRGDHTLQGLKAAKLLDKQGRIEVDILKVPHHGSDRNVETAYFERIRARHYVISADGKHHNPDIAALRMISEARPDDDFTIHLTYPTDEFNVPRIGEDVAAFFAEEKAAGRTYKVETRQPDELSLRIALA